MDPIDFTKQFKELYTAKRTVQEVVAGAGVFLAVEGQGAPGGAAFGQACEQLFSIVYTIKFGPLRQSVNFKVGSLETLYLSDPAHTPMAQWKWRLLIRIPDAVAAKDVTAAKKALKEKKGLDASAVKRIRWKEGRALQILHVGPYNQVGETYEQLQAAAAGQGCQTACPAHEIYLNSPCRTAPEKLKTIVRLPIKRRRSD
jgi:hypothetical protein